MSEYVHGVKVPENFDPMKFLAQVFHTGFSTQALIDFSLCVGWIVALSTEDTPDAIHRRNVAMRANDALVLLLGEGYHTKLVEELEREILENPDV